MAQPEQAVFVVDDDPYVRESLIDLFASAGLRAEPFVSAKPFLSRAESGACGCVVLDLRLPDLDGIAVLERLQERAIVLPVILITGDGDVSMAVQAMKRGAVDVLEKPFSPQVLLERVKGALELDAAARERRQSRTDEERRYGSLTAREREVVTLVAGGRANKQIARELEISQKTVELHRSNAMKKLGVQHVAGLVRAFLDHERGA